MEGCVDIWTPYKELYNNIQRCLLYKNPTALGLLRSSLRKHKQNFLNVLKNPPRNANSRKILQAGVTDGIHLPSIELRLLPQDMLDEALILSDMYDMDELVALDLLCTAEQQMPSYPGLPRGLVAILLYYDGHRSLVATLKTIMQVRSGFHWAVDVPEGVSEFLALYTSELVASGLVGKILEALEQTDLTKEIELLQKNRALGGPKHHHTVITIFETTRQMLADTIFLYSAQAGLRKQPLFALLNYMKGVKMEEDASGGIDNITLALEMALLFAIDINVLDKKEDVEEIPIISEGGLLSSLSQELKNRRKWECPGLHGLLQLALGVAIGNLRNGPQLWVPRDIIEEDESLVNLALSHNVFTFLYSTLLHSDNIWREEFYVRRLHRLFSDFIVSMPLKVKELRLNANEASRTSQVYMNEGLDPPVNLPRHFEMLLQSLAKLYESDKLGLKLHLDYWFDETGKQSEVSTKRSFQKVSLFKFVKQTGEALPPMLFVPYLKLLSALSSCSSSANSTFKLLKHNHVPTLTWDHFLISFHRYYNNLHLEQPPTSDTVYRHKSSYPKGIQPLEIQGLQAVLSVIRSVAEYDKTSRLAFCEDMRWNTVSVLLGLVGCPVEVTLKADLLLTLAALAKSPETATLIWMKLEASQIIVTIPSTSHYQSKGIITELEDVESRNEEYPLTIAMLKLLDVLTNAPVPKLLGVDDRTPGFDPYLFYIIEIFQKFHSRSYRNQSERWELGDECVKLFLKFLKQYDPKPDDFNGCKVHLEGGTTTQLNPPPGFRIMVNLCSMSQFFRMITVLIDEGCSLLDTYKVFVGKAKMEGLILSCLQLLQTAFLIQPNLMSCLRISNCLDVLLIPLNKMLLGINPRTGIADHLFNITKYVTYNSWLPQHALSAIKILTYITKYGFQQSMLISLYTSNSFIQNSMRNAFVECLEADDTSHDMEEVNKISIAGKIKKAILKLIIQCHSASSPNLAHYLLGYDLKDPKSTIFRKPGSMGFPRTCLHSVLLIHNASLLFNKDQSLMQEHPKLIELSHKLIYVLASNVILSDSILRFLRSSFDYIREYLAILPLTRSGRLTDLASMSYLLKTVSIELRVLEVRKQSTRVEEICTMLLQPPVDSAPESSDIILNTTNDETTLKLTASRLFSLIHLVEFSITEPEKPKWKFFNDVQLHEVIKQCERPFSKTSYKQVDIRKFEFILMQELSANVQGVGSTVQRQLILQEIKELISYMRELNEYKHVVWIMSDFFDSWRILVVIFFTIVPQNILSLELRTNFLLDMIYELLQMMVLNIPMVPRMATVASETLLLLLVNLRQCCVQQRISLSKTERQNVQVFMEASGLRLSNIINYLNLWILSSGNTIQNVRMNLYTCILNVVHLCCDNDNIEIGTRIHELDLRNVLNETFNNDYSIKYFDSKTILFGVFPKDIINILCEDAINGHPITKILCTSILSMLIDIEPHWISHIISSGYLRCIVESLVNSSEDLLDILSPNLKSLSPLYVYESYTSLLCKVASHKIGAEFLLEEKLLESFAAMDVFNNHPPLTTYDPSKLTMDDFIPDIGTRYLQIFTPVLTLCKAIIASIGLENDTAHSQILDLLMSHNEAVGLILRSATSTLDPNYMKELSELISVISPIFSQLSLKEVDRRKEVEKTEFTMQIQRTQRLIISLTSEFNISANVLTAVGNMVDEHNTNPLDRCEIVKEYLQIVANVLIYLQYLVSGSKSGRFIQKIILQPTLEDPTHSNKGFKGELTIGCMLNYITDGMSHYKKEKSYMQQLTKQLETINVINVDQLKKFVQEDASMTEDELRAEGSLQIMRIISGKKKELNMCLLIIETALYLCWAHLDYYMLRAIPAKTLNPNKIPSDMDISCFGDKAWNETIEQIKQLKHGLVVAFNESFTANLIEIAEDKNTMEKGYVDGLIHRIKKLLQFVPSK